MIMQFTRVIIPDWALSPPSNPLISLISENCVPIGRRVMAPIEENCPNGLCFCYQKYLSIPIESMSASHLAKDQTASLFWAFLLVFLIFSKLFVLYQKNPIYLLTTVSFDPKTDCSARIQPLSPIYPKSHLTHHVGGGGDRGRSLCGS